MNASILVRDVRLVIGLLLSMLLLSVPAAAQGEIGPEAVWQPTPEEGETLRICMNNPDCSLAAVMSTLGAPPAAIEFTQSRPYLQFLMSFQEHGRVDLGMIYLPGTNYLINYELLNGNPSIVSVADVGFPDMAAIPEYAALLAHYPDLMLWPGATTVESRPAPGSGQRFVARYPLVDGCHACDYLGVGEIAFDFDDAGNFLGITHLGPLPPEGQEPLDIAGQFAYIDEGNIMLANADGSDAQQLTTGGEDCCLAWSPDGRTLYFVRDPETKDGPQPNPGTIIAYSVATSQERIIDVPGVSVSGSLSISPDGRTLAFGSTEWVDIEVFGLSPRGCLHVFSLETGEDIVVDCEAPGAIYSTALSSTGEIAADIGFYEGSSIAFYDSPYSPRRFDDGICCIDPVFAPDGVGLFTNGAGYGSQSSSLIYYASPAADPDVLIEIPVEVGWVYGQDVSSDGKVLIYVHDEIIEIMDLESRATMSTGVAGYNPVWRPGRTGATVDLDPLLDRKEATFSALETTTYESTGGVIFAEPITAFDETAARALVAALRADPATVTSEQIALLERLVLQEETLAILLDDYSQLANDQADVAVDLASMVSGTLLLRAKASGGVALAVADILQSILEDFIALLLRFIDNEDLREAMMNGIDLAISLLDVVGNATPTLDDALSLGEELLERALDDDIRAAAARYLIPVLVDAAQPAIDQGVRSAAGAGSALVWPADGSAEGAAIQLRGLTDQSGIMRELAHVTYVDHLGHGRDVNEFLKDIVDLASIGSGYHIIPLILSLQARIQQILIDVAATSVLSASMDCTRDAAALSGEYAFLQRSAYTCKTPVPVDLGDFFSRLLTEGEKRRGSAGRAAPRVESVTPELDWALAGYDVAVDRLSTAAHDEDPAAVAAAADALALAAIALETKAAAVMDRLGPSPEASIESQLGLGVALSMVRFDAVLAQAAADAYLSDPAAADIDAFQQIVDTAAANAAVPARILPLVSLSASAEPPATGEDSGSVDADYGTSGANIDVVAPSSGIDTLRQVAGWVALGSGLVFTAAVVALIMRMRR